MKTHYWGWIVLGGVVLLGICFCNAIRETPNDPSGVAVGQSGRTQPVGTYQLHGAGKKLYKINTRTGDAWLLQEDFPIPFGKAQLQVYRWIVIPGRHQLRFE